MTEYVEYNALLHLSADGNIRMSKREVETDSQTITTALVVRLPRALFEENRPTIEVNIKDAGTHAANTTIVDEVSTALRDLPVSVNVRHPGSDSLIIEGITAPSDFSIGLKE